MSLLIAGVKRIGRRVLQRRPRLRFGSSIRLESMRSARHVGVFSFPSEVSPAISSKVEGPLHQRANQSVVPETNWQDVLAQNPHLLVALRARQPSDNDVQEVLPTVRVLHQAQDSAEESL